MKKILLLSFLFLTSNAGDGEHKIFEAIKTKHTREALGILKGQPSAVSVRGKYGQTPLMSAVIENNQILVNTIMAKSKKEINFQDKGGATALHIASRKGQVHTAAILLANGADQSIKDNQGHTPLTRAVDFGKIEIVKLLREDLSKRAE